VGSRGPVVRRPPCVHRGDVRVLDLVIRAGCEPCNAALSIAAGQGHLACVRYLHRRGVPLWDHLDYSEHRARGPTHAPGSLSVRERVLQLPGFRHHTAGEFPWGVSLRCVSHLWGVLRYGQIYGAPLPRWAGLVIEDRHEKARALLLAFYSGARRAEGGGEHVRLWELMANVPLDILRIIIVAAELELEGTFTV
jgi:hypothetical protein